MSKEYPDPLRTTTEQFDQLFGKRATKVLIDHFMDLGEKPDKFNEKHYNVWLVMDKEFCATRLAVQTFILEDKNRTVIFHVNSEIETYGFTYHFDGMDIEI
jgi:hypothetical protein